MPSTTPTSYDQLIQSLSRPPPQSCRAEAVNFAEAGLTEYKDSFATLIHDAFSPEECRSMLESAEASNDHKWDQATINVGGDKQALCTDVRLCDRIIWDDQLVAERIIDRVIPYLPEDIITLHNCSRITGHGPFKRNETWRISRLNERLRFLKYTRGMYFRPHCDATYITPDKKGMTFLTVHLYLNSGVDSVGSIEGIEDDSKKPLQGGATRFFGMSGKTNWDINPKTGSILVFQHRNLIHSGEDVLQGTKYTMRSDVIYEKVETDI